MTANLTIKEIAKKAKMKPAIVRSRLRRELKHEKGARWSVSRRQLPRVMAILKK